MGMIPIHLISSDVTYIILRSTAQPTRLTLYTLPWILSNGNLHVLSELQTSWMTWKV